MSNLINFTKRFGESLSQKVKLSNYSWFNLGGNAEFFFKPKDKTELLEFFKEAKKNDIKTTFLGAGSNILFRDNGVKGAVIKLGKNFSFTRLIGKDIIEVGAGTLDRKVANFAKENNLTNLEFLSCIPGSIGGAIIMNSGCYDYDISQILVSIRAVDKKNLKEIELKKKDINFVYRGNNLPEDLIFLSATFKGKKKDRRFIEEEIKNLTNIKNKNQPMREKTGGSTFKNPINQTKKKVWELIRDAVSIDKKFGDAYISNKHCNFFINKGNASFEDMKNLIDYVSIEVFKKTGIKLEKEIKILE